MSAYTETLVEAAENARVHMDRTIALLVEADRLCWKLEELNVADRKSVPAAMRRRLLELVGAVLELDEPLTDRHKAVRETQPALDHLFDKVYPVLFYWHAADTGNLEAFNAGQVKDEES